MEGILAVESNEYVHYRITDDDTVLPEVTAAE